MRLWLAAIAASIGWLAALSEAKCYYPDGSQETRFAYNYQPCNGRNTTFSQCCIPGQDICTPNGLCTHEGNNIAGNYDYRPACANKDWRGCQKLCPGVQPYSWVQVKQCATGEYCCNPNFDNGDCCKDKSPRFNVKTPTPKPKPVTKTSSSSLSSTPPSMSTSALSSDAAQPTSPDGSSNNYDNGDTSSPKPKSKSMTGPIVGGVVGGIAAIAAVGGLWWFFRRKSMARAAAAAAASTDPAKQQCLPSEMDGSPVLVESDSKPIPRPVYEMSG